MVFDCSFDLMNPAAGEEQYRKAHIPGAVYANLDTDLSDQGVVDARRQASSARRRRPRAAAIRCPAARSSRCGCRSVGFANDMQAVVYDRNGANYCGRLWWMLKWAGHEAVAVLDGGLQAWQAAGGEVTDREEPSHFQSNFELGRRAALSSSTTQDVLGAARQARPDAHRCAGRAALSRRGRAAGPGGGPHPRRAEPALHRRTSAPTASSSPRPQLRAEFEQLLAGPRPGHGRAPLRQRRQRRAQPARDGNRGPRARPRCMPAAGASGAAIRSARSRKARNLLRHRAE